MKEVPHVIGIDLGKSVFQVHAVDAGGPVVARRRLRRSEVMSFLGSYPSTIVAMEACATAHFWAREIGALGHEVRLIAPQYARAYVKPIRTTQQTPRRSAKQRCGRRCGSSQQSRPISKRCKCYTALEIS